jgi:hypothetical protein
MLDLAVFVPRLKQVIVWTEHLMQNFAHQYNALDNSRIFRQINPVINSQSLYKFNSAYTEWSVEWNIEYDYYDSSNFEQALQQAVEQREAVSIPNNGFADFQKLGRILYLETQLITCDGGAAYESHGFIDENDVPPIDTWFYLDKNIQQQYRKVPNLFCWIPKRFELIMEEAMRVEIFDSYHWLDEKGPLTHQQIVAAMAE